MSVSTESYPISEDSQILDATTTPQTLQSPFYPNHVGSLQLHYMIRGAGLLTLQVS